MAIRKQTPVRIVHHAVLLTVFWQNDGTPPTDAGRRIMKVLQVSGLGYPAGGIETELVAMRTALRDAGHSVRTISSNAGSKSDRFSDYQFDVPRSLVLQVIDRTFNLKAYRLVKAVCAEYQPDVVTYHSMYLPSASSLYAAIHNSQVLFVHGPEYYTKWLLRWLVLPSQYKSRPYDKSDITITGRAHYAYLRYIIRPIFLLRIRRMSHVLAFSRSTQNHLTCEGICSTYIPNGVELFESKEMTAPKFKLGFAGRLIKDKGIEYLIESFAQVVASCPNARFAVAGDGAEEYKALLRKKVDGLGLTNKVAFLGQLDREGLQLFYSDIDLLLMASFHEAFGMVGVEAMSAGTPVLAPNVGGITDWLDSGVNGRLIPLDDSGAVARNVLELLGDPTELERLSRNAAESSRRFDIKAHVGQIVDYFEEIISPL